MKLTDLRGVGPKTALLFERLGIHSAEDLLRYYPVHYESYLPPLPVREVKEGEKCAVLAEAGRNIALRHYERVTIVTADLKDATGNISAIWYNAPFMRTQLKPGSPMVYRGTAVRKQNRLILQQPEVMTPEAYAEKERTLLPIYALTKGLGNGAVRRAVREALQALPRTEEYLPDALLAQYHLAGEADAVRDIHFPSDTEQLLRARTRLVFDEFLLMILAMKKLRGTKSRKETAYPVRKTPVTDQIISRLPYTLTSAQKRVWAEIEQDLTGSHPMSRLLQGDVGSGKTIIAFLALICTAKSGWQCALMAPTEVLARQHFEKLMKMKKQQKLDFLHPVLLTGSLAAGERREALSAIADGSANAVVGTHALIQAGVAWHGLGLVITDEQHRFGVHQREALLKEDGSPHTLVMSATPIPRTLGIIYYGDLDISVIDEPPAGRTPIKSCVVDESYRNSALAFLEKELSCGRQAYVICPMIEPSEGLDVHTVTEEYAAIRRRFPKTTVGLLHGRMRTEEKNRVMARFLDGKIRILVSTTVVEVGVDVPNATVMLIENAERYGLAQLHQLRGRVGRGEYASYCIFMTGQSSDTVKKRLDILTHSQDGFEIAKADLSLRGPGDLLGIRQSGDMLFHIADISRDGEILGKACEAAEAITAADPDLVDPVHAPLAGKLASLMEEEEQNLTL